MKRPFSFQLLCKFFFIFLLLSLMPSSFGSNTPFIAHAQQNTPDTQIARRGFVLPASETYAQKINARLQVVCYTLTLTNTGTGSAPTASPTNSTGCALGDYVADEIITLTANPAAGYSLGSWTGTNGPSSNQLTMPASAHTVTANYVAICYTLTSTNTGTGSAPTAIPLNSTNCPAGQYIVGESIAMTAHPAAGYSVGSWVGTTNDLSTSTSNTVSMPANNHAVAANYVAVCYPLTRNHTGTGSDPTAIPANSTGCAAGQYTVGESIAMTASPGTGYSVGSWVGTTNDLSTALTNTVTMPASAHTVNANYVAICYTLTRTLTGTGSAPTAIPTNSTNCPTGQYVAGESIAMTAHPSSGYSVSSWVGTTNDLSTALTNTVTMPANNHTVTANYIANCYTLTRTHTGTGGDPTAVPANSTGCSVGQYIVGESIAMTASPGTGQAVGSWVGTTNDVSTSTSNTVTMPASNHTVTVNYVAVCYTLTRTFTGTGSAPTANPANSTGCAAGQYTFGQSITMTAHPAAGYSVASWVGTMNDTSTALTNTVTMPAGNHTVTANYVAICYTLTRTFTGTGSAPTASPLNSTGCLAGQYIVGESITMTANPAAGYSVSGWAGTTNNASTSLTNTVTMPASNHTVTANYVAICYTLTKNHTGTGTNPTGDPANSPSCPAGQYIVGQSITMTATPATGQAVGGWIGTVNDTSTSTSNTVTMPASNHTVTVNYVAVCYTLTRTFTGTGSAPTASPLNSTGCPAGQYTYTQSITMTAHPAAGYSVNGWIGTTNDSSTSPTNTVTMPANNHTVTAKYKAICYTLTRTFTGVGSNPTASPSNSSGCTSGKYIVGQSITLTALPGPGYHLERWTGTNGPFSNLLTMPASDQTIIATYVTAEDIYEPDDTYNQAKVITSGSPQTRSIIPRTDFDWVKFTLNGTSAVTLEVIGPTDDDTRMWLYNSNQTELAFSDDDGTGSYSYLSFVCGVNPLPPGTYYAKIDEYGNNNEIPSYDTFLTVQTCPMDRDTTGVFRPSNGALYLKNKNETGFADVQINYGLGGDYPVVGDWDGNGTVTIGIYRNGSFYLRNSNTIGFADFVFPFGMPGDQPIAGDWDGDGDDTIGVYRSSTGTFFLRNDNSAGAPDMSFGLGIPGDVGIAGDWNGDGMDTTGVFRPSNGALYLKNKNSTGFADIQINYGLPGDQPITGDWNSDGVDTIGIYRNGAFYLRNSNTIGFADLVFGLGVPGDHPIAGNWDGE